ncbi:MAG: glycoside hydrolase family 43 protein [Lachnospiraceae bacterium]|nr:glycoside hydrolase family 43 protein [Lachnospiraceae bacterium]
MREKHMRKKRMVGLLLAMAMVTTACGTTSGDAASSHQGEADVATIATGNQELGISCHDPQILNDNGTYYMTGSHIVLAKSEDLQQWDYISNGNAKNYISNLYSGDLEAFSYVGKNEDGGYSLWAGNIFYNETMGKYCLYFCTSSSYIKSTLALAVSDTPEGPYEYTDTLLYSGFSKKEADQTDLYDVIGEEDDSRYFKLGGYNNNLWPNCIDPAVYTDADGRIWMVYGSWSGGIFALEIDAATGLPIHPEGDEANGVDPYFGYHLIGGGHHACEGAYMTYNSDNGYYYLFVSYGNLQREGGYQIRQFRSTSPVGPFVDAAGNTLGDQEDYFSYGLKMAGNYDFPSLETAYMAPGGQSVFFDTDGNPYMVYHQRFDQGTEYHEPRVHRMYLTGDDWYVMTPFAYTGEEERMLDIQQNDFAGTYYVVNHETDVSNVIHRAVEWKFGADGSISGEAEGNYTISDDSGEITVTLDGVTYTGVVIRMDDEAGNPLETFMATGNNNETLWGVKYLKED